ncbi:hypothetical protein ACP70R_012103 [Stipagrostis hirtigluma subsp. patula]
MKEDIVDLGELLSEVVEVGFEALRLVLDYLVVGADGHGVGSRDRGAEGHALSYDDDGSRGAGVGGEVGRGVGGSTGSWGKSTPASIEKSER